LIKQSIHPHGRNFVVKCGGGHVGVKPIYCET